MLKHEVPIEVGLSREEVISRLGEPDRVEYIKISFRPPHRDESEGDYQEALREWEKRTIGEIMIYDETGFIVEVSKLGQVVKWRKGKVPGKPPGEQGLVTVEPDENSQ